MHLFLKKRKAEGSTRDGNLFTRVRTSLAAAAERLFSGAGSATAEDMSKGVAISKLVCDRVGAMARAVSEATVQFAIGVGAQRASGQKHGGVGARRKTFATATRNAACRCACDASSGSHLGTMSREHSVADVAARSQRVTGAAAPIVLVELHQSRHYRARETTADQTSAAERRAATAAILPVASEHC